MATNDFTLGSGGEGAQAFAVDAGASNPLTLPEGLNPATADYAHEGPDLVMTWPDGSEVTVTNYFMVDPQPDLMGNEGAKVDADLASRLAGSDTPGMVAEAGTGVAEQPIGQVEKLAGTVTVIRADGTKVELNVGDPVYQGDILETGADGAIGVILADETTFSMAEEGRMVLDEMVYDPGTMEGSVSLSIMQGVFTVVSGNVAKTDPDAMSLHTPVATIGIRGTQVGLDISDGQNLKVALMEEADGFVGEIVVSNDGGVSVLNGANEFTVISSFALAPTETIVLDTVDIVNSFASSLRYLPLNNENVNDFGLQGDTQQQGMDGEGLADFETASGGDDAINADGLADFDVAGGGDNFAAEEMGDFVTNAGEDQAIDGITVAIDQQVTGIVDIEILNAPPSTTTSQPPETPRTPSPPPEEPPVDDPTPKPDPSGGTPSASIENASTNEDGSVALTVSASTTDANDPIETVTVSGVPADATLSVGSQTLTPDANGDYKLTPDQLDNLTLTPKGDFSGSFTLSVSATTSGGTTTTPVGGTVYVAPVVDIADASVSGSASGAEDGTFALDITSSVGDVDGSESITGYVISNIPDGAKLSAGTDNGDGTWSLTPAQLSGLTITPPADFSGTISLGVQATVQDTNGTETVTDTVSGTISVDVTPVADAPTLTAQASAGLEDNPIDLNITTAETDVDGSEVLSLTITGVPTGATLSAGTQNADGSWTLSEADLNGLQLNPPANFNGTINLTVTSTSTDTVGNVSDSASTSADLTVSVAPVGDTPDIVANPATGAEDGTVPLNFSATATGGETIASYTISGVPTGATLSAGTDNGDGSWTLTPDQVSGLTLTPVGDFSGTFNLTVTATSNEGGVNSANMGVSVTPVADAPTLSASAGTAAEDTPIDLTIATAETDVDGSEVLSMTITGVPTGATLSAGTKNADGSWTLDPGTDLSGLQLTPPANFFGTITLGITSTSTDTLGNVSDSASTTTALTIDIPNTPDVPTLVTGAGEGQEDGTVPLTISATGTGGVAVTSITITGVPSDAKLSAGTLNNDGSWTLTPDQLSGLTLTPAGDFSGTFDLGVTATSADGSTATASSSILVTPVADAPTLTAQAATGSEDTAIALNIATAETDVDGSEVLSMTISGVPAGATLSAGTKNADGTWTLDPATDLANLTLTPPLNFSGTINLTVTSTSTDTLGNISDSASTTTDLAVTVVPVGDNPGINIHGGGSGVEDGTVDIGLVVTPANTLNQQPGTENVTSIVVAGVPDGATLSAGTKNADGTWTISTPQASDITNLTMTPAPDYSGTSTLTFTVTTNQGGVSTASLPVTVTPVADAPTLSATAGTAAEDTPIDLTIATAETDVDGSEVLSMTIAGVPDGATLSAGTKNADGSWTLDPATDLAGLQLTPPANFNGTIDLTITSTSTDTLGNVSDSASTTTTLTVDVTPVPDAPNLVTGAGQGQEDGTVPLNIAATGTGGVPVSSITITGVPTGASLSAGTQNTDGSWTLTPDQLSGLTLTPVGDFSGTFDLGVTATSADGATTTASSSILVTPVADAPTLSATAATGAEDTAIPLDIQTAETDVDGSEVLSMTITGVPTGATLSAGTQNADGSWTLDPATDLAGLTMTPPANFNGTIDLTVTSTSTDTLGNISDSASTTTTLSVEVTPVADGPSVSTTDASGLEDNSIPLDITADPVGGVAVESITITGVPSGASLSTGTDNGNGTWTLTPDQLTGLTVTPPQDYSGTFDLGVTATSADGGTASATVPVAVEAVADAPDLSGSAAANTTGGTPIEPSDYTNVQFGAGDDDDDDEGDHGGQNNGWGNGDQDAPGNSLDNNNAENDTSDKRDDPSSDKSGSGYNKNKSSDDDDDDDRGHDDDDDDGDNHATDDDDEIEGTSGDDLLAGGAGDDQIDGKGGDDVIFGGSGDDRIDGGKGDDILIGGSGNDTLNGGDDDDTLYGGSGNDHLIGGEGDDTAVFSGARSDYLITEVEGSEGQYIVEHLNGGDDGMNLIEGVENFEFTDGTYGLDDMLSSNPTTDATLTYDITIQAAETDIDGSETLSDITITDVPQGATFSAGTQNDDGSWTMTSNDLNGLTMDVSENVSADFTLSISVTSTEPNGSAATTTSTIDVALPDGWGADTGVTPDTDGSALDPLAAMFEDSNTLTFDGEEYDISELTEGDNDHDYGDVTPLGSKSGSSDDDGDDTSYQESSGDGYSSADSSGDDSGGYDDSNNNC